MNQPPFTVEDAVRIAAAAHEGQFDRNGEPYIDHPLRVMSRVEGEHARMAAVLHDVLEDSHVTAADLVEAGCPPHVVATVEALTHSRGEPRVTYLARLVRDPVAIIVKRADVADNTDPRRLSLLPEHVRGRLVIKYAATKAFLDDCERATSELGHTPTDTPGAGLGDPHSR